ANATEHIETILHGLQGKTIEGVSYAAVMPGFENMLSDAEIAAIVNHERTSWGNDAPTVTAEDVAKVRAGGVLEDKGGASTSDGGVVPAGDGGAATLDAGVQALDASVSAGKEGSK